MLRKKIHDALSRLAAEERKFLEAEFLAPVLRGGRVGVRIVGVVCQMRVTPADFEGFGVFKPVSHAQATLVRPARCRSGRSTWSCSRACGWSSARGATLPSA